jgi:hypothetical protein
MALGFCSIHGRHLTPESSPGFGTFLSGLYALDTAPTLASLGFDQAHFIRGMMGPAVIAKLGF